MRRTFVASILLLAVLLAGFALPVQAQVSQVYDRSTTAGKAFVDTLLWHKGLSNAKTCTLIAAEKDTSTRFPLAGIDIFAAQFLHTKGQGRAGDSVTYALSCSLQVSIDGNNWMTDTGVPLYSVTSSASITEAVHRVFVGFPDTAVTATDIAGPRAKMFVQGAMWGRFVTTQVGDLKDTCYFRGADFRVYRR